MEDAGRKGNPAGADRGICTMGSESVPSDGLVSRPEQLHAVSLALL